MYAQKSVYLSNKFCAAFTVTANNANKPKIKVTHLFLPEESTVSSDWSVNSF